MKKTYENAVLLKCFLSVCIIFNTALLYGQQPEIKITNQFDSIEVSNVTANGNQKNKTISLSFEIKNNYTRQVVFSLLFTTYDDFGALDSSGKKYTYDTRNNNFGAISSIQFGDKKPNDFSLMQITFEAGESKRFSLLLNKVNNNVKYITNFHVNMDMALDLVHLTPKNPKLQIENIKIDWNNTND